MMSTKTTLEGAFDAYLRVGGFPGVQSMEPVDRRRTLQDSVDLVALKWLVAQLLSSFSREFSINRLHNDLKSQGVPVGKDTLHACLDHLIDARMIHTASIRRASFRARQVNRRRVYAVDPGLASAVARPSAQGTGHLLENTVYLELRRQYNRLHDDAISYFTEKAGRRRLRRRHDGRQPACVAVCPAHALGAVDSQRDPA